MRKRRTTMPKYEVTLRLDAYRTVDIEAMDKETAVAMALSNFTDGTYDRYDHAEVVHINKKGHLKNLINEG
jgi:hypothetical protein